MSDEKPRATLSDKQARGGVIGGKGYGFQAAYIVSRIPLWLADPDFVQFLQEGAGDVDVRFKRADGEERWYVQVKNYEVKPAKAREVLAQFRDTDTGSPGTYIRFTLACPGLHADLKRLRAAVEEFRGAAPFYRPGQDKILDNTWADLENLVGKLKLPVDAAFLVDKVHFDTDLAGLTDDANLCDLFVGRLLKLETWARVTRKGAARAYEKLALLSHQAIRQTCSREQVEALIQEAVGELPAEPTYIAPEAPFLVPFPRNPDFVGREEDLERLHEMIHQGDSPVGIRPTVLVGLGGIGKTQLAVEYAHAHRDDYPGGVFWLNAVNPLLHEFADLAETLGLADRETPRERAARQAWAYLDAHPDALVVFDNVVEPADLNVPFAPGLVPANLRCRTLFTTRQRDFPRTFQPFEVKVLPEMAAMRLLLRARPEVLEEHHPEWGAARIVCASLGWLPLALELAAAYLGEYTEVTLEGYLERLRTEGRLTTVDDTELHPEDLPTRHEAAVAATLRTQWSRLDDEAARLLFRAAGQFPEATWIPIPRLGLLTGIEAEAKLGRPAPLTRALKKLHVVSLIEELTGDRLRLHPLVQEFATGLSPASFRFEMAARVAAALSDLLNLEAQVIRRGIYAVLEDLRTGLWLCVGGAEVEPTYAQLTKLERVLDREAHNLRGWKPAAQPAYFLQQIAYRAITLKLIHLAAAAAVRLARLGKPCLALRWRAGRESPALERTLAGHGGWVYAVAVTPDGRRIISASDDHTLKVWDLQTGQEERTLAGHEDAVNAVAVTPDGRCAISASKDHTLKVWDLQTGQEERTLAGHADSVLAVAVTPDGRRIISASDDHTLKVWDLQTGQEERTLAGHEDAVNAVALTPDGHRAISLSGDCTLKVWDLQTGDIQVELAITRYPLGGHAVAVTPDGRYAISASISTSPISTPKVWDLQTWQEERTLSGPPGGYKSVAVTSDGRHVVSARSQTLMIWNLQTGRRECTLAGHADQVFAVAVTPDGRRAVSASADRTLKVWDLQTRQQERTPAGHESWVFAVAVTPDGRRAISTSDDCTLKVWDLETGQEERTLHHAGGVLGVAVTPDGQCAISASISDSPDDTLKVWDLRTGRVERTLGTGHELSVLGVAVTPDGRRIISASDDRTLKVWDLETGHEERTLGGHQDEVWAVAVTPDGRRAISASEDRTLKIWDLQSGHEERTLAGHADWVLAVAVTPDGQCAISASVDGTLKVWDLQTGQEERTLAGHQGAVWAVAVPPDGRCAISASADHTLRVWHLQTGRQLAMITLEYGVDCVAIAPDSTTIVAGDKGGNVYCLRYAELGRWMGRLLLALRGAN